MESLRILCYGVDSNVSTTNQVQSRDCDKLYGKLSVWVTINDASDLLMCAEVPGSPLRGHNLYCPVISWFERKLWAGWCSNWTIGLVKWKSSEYNVLSNLLNYLINNSACAFLLAWEYLNGFMSMTARKYRIFEFLKNILFVKNPWNGSQTPTDSWVQSREN